MPPGDPTAQPSWTRPRGGDAVLRRLPVIGRAARMRHHAGELHEGYEAAVATMRADHEAAVARMRAHHSAAVADMNAGFYRDESGTLRHVQDDPAAMRRGAQLVDSGWRLSAMTPEQQAVLDPNVRLAMAHIEAQNRRFGIDIGRSGGGGRSL